MVKKLAALAGAGALIASTVIPVFGDFRRGGNDIEVENEDTRVYTSIYTKADSGDNTIMGMCVRGGSIKTGAASAYSWVTNDVNSTRIGCPGCRGDVEVENEDTKVKTSVYTKADSGDNGLYGFHVGGGRIRTGAAYAYSDALSLVNYTLVGTTP